MCYTVRRKMIHHCYGISCVHMRSKVQYRNNSTKFKNKFDRILGWKGTLLLALTPFCGLSRKNFWRDRAGPALKFLPFPVSVIQITHRHFYYRLAIANYQKITSHSSRGLVYLSNHPTINRLWVAWEFMQWAAAGWEVSDSINNTISLNDTRKHWKSGQISLLHILL